MIKTDLVLGILLLCPLGALHADDWPEWRGEGRRGVWKETGILEAFAPEGLDFKWRTPIRSGYAGPAVSNGRIFVADWKQQPESLTLDGTERLLCLDQETGRVLWSDEWATSYRVLMASYAIGPRATPTVDEDRVYVVGATGVLRCLDAETGRLIWSKDFVQDYGTSVAIWGISSSPLVDGDRLICLVGGEPDAKVMAFDKRTGREIWRSLSSEWELGYAQPVILEGGGQRQLIIWHPKALAALVPETGKVLWEIPFKVGAGMTVATPVWQDGKLLISQFYGGSMMLRLNPDRPAAQMLWKGKSTSEMPKRTDGLHSLLTTPIIQGDYIYGICSYGQLRCLEAETGKRIWETLDMTEFNRWAAAFMVRHGDRYFVNNDQGDLIIARFTPERYVEVDRTKLIEPTTKLGRKRLVHWSHPAYSNGHIYVRNDKEILSASLEEK